MVGRIKDSIGLRPVVVIAGLLLAPEQQQTSVLGPCRVTSTNESSFLAQTLVARLRLEDLRYGITWLWGPYIAVILHALALTRP